MFLSPWLPCFYPLGYHLFLSPWLPYVPLAVSCAMRCHRVSSGVPKYWIDQFTWAVGYYWKREICSDDSVSKQLKETTCFDVECVRALGKGLQLGREMGIPEQLHLNSGHVKSLVVADRTVRSFTEMLSVSHPLPSCS